LLSNLGPAAEKEKDPLAQGKELFTREWLAGDRRSFAGDGLGPLFNARSCGACHFLGGVGGAGPRHANVMIASIVLEPSSKAGIGFIGGMPVPTPKTPLKQPSRDKLAEIHPALRTGNSFPLHRFSTEKEFSNWRSRLLGGQTNPSPEDLEPELSLDSLRSGSPFASLPVGNNTIDLIGAERNTPALFGVGLIDRIPERVLEKVAAIQAQTAPKRGSIETSGLLGLALPVSGRIARLKDGRIGRFGWKAQTATLREFTLQACASEIGLEVPGFSQTALPWKKGYKAPGLDLSANQCDDLIRFVASLPPPARKSPETDQHADEIAVGQRLFERIGCASCHRPKLGDVDGIYSDLLLHDMGENLSDNGQYGGSILAGQGTADQIDPVPVVGNTQPDGKHDKPKFGASSREWRTPPLWGLRDSAPYLHDGRAETLGLAILQHEGEGFDAAQQFMRMPMRERQQLELFLLSLGAPAQEEKSNTRPTGSSRQGRRRSWASRR
jgi:CxxC motif-containing protein (DUF1111 family)